MQIVLLVGISAEVGKYYWQIPLPVCMHQHCDNKNHS
jgi:hypothetical protein